MTFMELQMCQVRQFYTQNKLVGTESFAVYILNALDLHFCASYIYLEYIMNHSGVHLVMSFFTCIRELNLQIIL